MLLPTTILQVLAAGGRPRFVERAMAIAALTMQTVGTAPEEEERQGGAVAEEKYDNAYCTQ